jgi:hypothetical protein
MKNIGLIAEDIYKNNNFDELNYIIEENNDSLHLNTT